MSRWEDWDREHGTLPTPATDYSQWPAGYSILLNEKIMHPEDLSLWKMKLDCKRQLFVDDYLIAHNSGVQRQMHAVDKHPANPLFKDDWPLYFHRDDEGFRVYSKTFKSTSCVRLSYSQDGIHWQDPELNVCDLSHDPQGYRAGPNNVVQPRGQVHGLFFEPDDPEPQRRWKMILGGHRRSKPVTWPYLKKQGGFYKNGEYVELSSKYVRQEEFPEQVSFYELHTSEDGIKWTYETDTSLQKSQSHVYTPLHRPLGIGDVLNTRWDPVLNKYIAHGKCFIGPDFRFQPCNETRAVLWSESDDLIHWGSPRVYAYPDMKDAQTFGMYGIYEANGWPYESMWLGCLSMTAYFPHPNTDWITKKNWIVLAGSRDGHTWFYLGDRQPFIPNGPGDSWDAHYIRVSNSSNSGAPLLQDDKLWFYYYGNYGGTTEFSGLERSDKSRWQFAGGLGTLRRDGFASLNANANPGLVITRPFVFSGEGNLHINADVANGGHVKVAVLAEDASELPAFAEANCKGITSDTTEGGISWKQRENLGQLKGRYIRMAFHLRQAKLYSFWID